MAFDVVGLDLACVKVRSDDPGLLAWSFGEVGAEPSVAEFLRRSCVGLVPAHGRGLKRKKGIWWMPWH
jgi:hypothetical protein